MTSDTDEEEAIPSLDELSSLLGNETRMAVVRTLWSSFDFEAYVIEAREGTSYSTLFDAAPIEDSGNFNYHLRQLEGVLVTNREDGYVLTPLGYNLMSAIDRYDDYEYVTLEERVVADPCPYCDGDLVASYNREVLSVRCRDCDGLGSDGNFTFVEVPASGGWEPSMPTLLDVATLALFEKVRASGHGVCWDCRAPMERSLSLCSTHEPGPGGVCAHCDLRYRAEVQASCPTCGTGGTGPVLEYAAVAPQVAAFFERQGRGPGQQGPWAYRLAVLGSVTEDVTATDPVAVTLTFECGGERTTVTVRDRPDGVEVTAEP